MSPAEDARVRAEMTMALDILLCLTSLPELPGPVVTQQAAMWSWDDWKRQQAIASARRRKDAA